MRPSIYSPIWSRYSQMRPQLLAGVTLQQTQSHHQQWSRLSNNSTGTHYRINFQAYQFIGRCDGRNTTGEIWEILPKILGDQTPSQDELIHLLTELDRHDLLHHAVNPDLPQLYRFRQNIACASGWQKSFMLLTLIVLSVLALCVIPVPVCTTAQGVIWLPEQARLRSGTEGFIKEIRVRHGDAVETGQLLVILENPALQRELDHLSQQLTDLRNDHSNIKHVSPGRANDIAKQVTKISEGLQLITERMARLQLRSPGRGILKLPRQDQLTGSFVRQGDVLGLILDKNTLRLRAALPKPDAARVALHLTGVDIKMAEHPNLSFGAQMVTELSSPDRTSLATAVEDRANAKFITAAIDQNGVSSKEPLVMIDLRMPSAMIAHDGSRASVRFLQGTQSIAAQTYRRLCLEFSRNFSANT